MGLPPGTRGGQSIHRIATLTVCPCSYYRAELNAWLARVRNQGRLHRILVHVRELLRDLLLAVQGERLVRRLPKWVATSHLRGVATELASHQLAAVVRTEPLPPLHENAELAVCRDRRGRACPVRVGGRQVDSLCRLADGDLLEFGEPACCVWHFRLPVAGSATAVLQPPAGRQAAVWSARGERIERVVLMADKLLIGVSRPAHVVLNDLPCKQLLFVWRKGRLHWEIEGGRARMEIAGQTLDQPGSEVYVPSRLVIEPELDEAEWLGRMVAQCEPAERMVLDVDRAWAGTESIA